MTIFTALSGRTFDYLDPKDINLEDVAIGLSRAPRFVGQTGRAFSVAQHSMLVAELCPRFRLYALIHDAAEAFLCDLPTPAKEALRAICKDGKSPYDELEARMYAAICRAVCRKVRYPISVKIADELAYNLERSVLRDGNDPEEPMKSILKLKDGGKVAWLNEIRKELT